MPKKGKKNQATTGRGVNKRIQKLRNEHSGVESNINSLEHHGLNRCPDKGKKGLYQIRSKSVLAYNIHRFGMVLINQQEKQHLKKLRKSCLRIKKKTKK